MIVAVFALQSIVYYGLMSWMPDCLPGARLERRRGRRAASAVLGFVALPGGLLAARGWPTACGSRRQWLGLTCRRSLVATFGLAARARRAAVLWAALAGLGDRRRVPALPDDVPLDVAHEPADAGAAVGADAASAATDRRAGARSASARCATSPARSRASLWVLFGTALLLGSCRLACPLRRRRG